MAPPVRVAIVADARGIFDPQQWARRMRPPPWTSLSEELAECLRRPVQIETLEPDQIAFHLESGRLHFAFVSAEALEQMTESAPDYRIIAVSQARRRQGVIVARAGSGVKSIADLKGRRFAFGPRGDDIMDRATVEALEAGGVRLADLSREILPIPGLYQHHISSFEAAKEVAFGLGTDAGVVEAAEFDAYPATGGKLGLWGPRFSKDMFVELGRTREVVTPTIDGGSFIAAHWVSPDLVAAVRRFLLDADECHPQVTRGLGLAQFRPAPGPLARGGAATD